MNDPMSDQAEGNPAFRVAPSYEETMARETTLLASRAAQDAERDRVKRWKRQFRSPEEIAALRQSPVLRRRYGSPVAEWLRPSAYRTAVVDGTPVRTVQTTEPATGDSFTARVARALQRMNEASRDPKTSR